MVITLSTATGLVSRLHTLVGCNALNMKKKQKKQTN